MQQSDRDRLSGKNGYIRVIDARNSRIRVPIVSWDAEMTTVFQDITGSVNYSPADGIVYRASAPVVRYMTSEVKGCYRRSNTPTYVIAKLYNGNEPFQVELGFSPLDPFANFYAWVENFRTSSPVMDIVRFECSLRSEGTITDLTNLVAVPLGPD